MHVRCPRCGAQYVLPSGHPPARYRCGVCDNPVLVPTPARADPNPALSISGMVGGAALGASLGGPVGAVVGGIVGFLVGSSTR